MSRFITGISLIFALIILVAAAVVLFTYWNRGQSNRTMYTLKSPGGTTYEIRPGDDFKSVYSQLQPGDELVFHQGEYRISEYNTLMGYRTFLYLDNPGLPDKPIILRGYGKGQRRPVFKIGRAHV